MNFDLLVEGSPVLDHLDRKVLRVVLQDFQQGLRNEQLVVTLAVEHATA